MQPSPMFQRHAFDPDTIHAMGAAFDEVCRALDTDGHDVASRLVARKIIELARAGERDQARLCSETLAYFGLDGNGGACAAGGPSSI